MDIDPEANGEEEERIPTDAPTMTFGRYFIKAGTKDKFVEIFAAEKHHLAEIARPRPFVEGGGKERKGSTGLRRMSL